MGVHIEGGDCIRRYSSLVDGQSVDLEQGASIWRPLSTFNLVQGKLKVFETFVTHTGMCSLASYLSSFVPLFSQGKTELQKTAKKFLRDVEEENDVANRKVDKAHAEAFKG
jgi:hypothetical protein